MIAALELQRVSKHFAGVQANRDIDLRVEPLECHAVIGPNGAGKTTLIAQIAGEVRPDSGCILLEGKDVTRWSVPRRAGFGLARSFQVTELMKGMTAADNVALAVQARLGHSFRFFANALRDPALRDPARAALDRIGLGARAQTPVEALAHGECRQLELAMALAMEPKLLVLDEPMAGLGAGEAERMIELLASIRGRTTMLFVEHDMKAVFTLADRVSVIAAGTVICTGSPEAVRANREVQAAYLGVEELS